MKEAKTSLLTVQFFMQEYFVLVMFISMENSMGHSAKLCKESLPQNSSLQLLNCCRTGTLGMALRKPKIRLQLFLHPFLLLFFLRGLCFLTCLVPHLFVLVPSSLHGRCIIAFHRFSKLLTLSKQSNISPAKYVCSETTKNCNQGCAGLIMNHKQVQRNK